MTAITSITDQLRGRVFPIVGWVKYQLLERQFIHTIRIGLVVTTLALTLLTAFLIVERGEIGFAVVGGIAALCGLILVYRYFAYVVLALIITTTVAAPEIPRDITTTLLLLILLTLIWLSRLLLVERSFQSLRSTPVNRFVPLFALTVIISFVWSNSYADAQIIYLQNDKALPRIVTALVMILSPVATLLFANFVRNISQMKWLIGFYLIFGAFAMIPKLMGVRPPSNFNIGGQLSAWVTMFALGQLLCNDSLSRWQRFGLLIIIGGWVYIAFVMERSWLSGWVPLFMGLAIITFLRARSLFWVMAVIAAIYVMANMQAFDSLLEEENSISGQTRLQAGNLIIDIANQHFLFGTGPTGYYFYMMVSLKNRLFQLSHNNYVDIYAQTGILGFAAYMLIWGSIGLTVWRTYRLVPKRGFAGGVAVSLVAIFVITMVIMMLGDWVTPFTYTQTMRGLSYTIWPWLWAGLAIALSHIASQNQTPQPQQQAS